MDRSGRLFPPHSSVLIALSGGPDSVCLTLLLKAFRRSRSLRLAAAHVHHGLRASADTDARWVKEFCRRQGLECYVLQVDVRGRAKREQASVEEAARRARYEALLRLARKKKFDILVTAHTADDQAETVLMRLATGSGIWGLASISSVRTEKRVRIVRPLLEVSKKDLLAALKRARAAFRTDRSNASADFLRNRVRQELMPRLARRLNPRIAEHLSYVASDAAAWRAWADEEAGVFLRRFARRSGKTLRVSVKSLRGLPPPLRVPVFFKICETLTQKGQHLRREHIRQIEELLEERGPSERRLASGLTVRKTLAKTGPQIAWSAARP